MFLTQEKALRRVVQERQKGDRKRALDRARSALEKYPGDYDLSMEAIRLSLDLRDLKEAVSLMKATIRKHPKSRNQLLSIAGEELHGRFNPLLASFVIEYLIRARDLDSARNVMRQGPHSYLDGMIKRSKTRSEGFGESGSKKTASYIENEILLGLLYIEAKRFAEAAEPLGRALKSLPDEAQLIGQVLLEAERENPDSSMLQYYLGIASILLDHPEKAEVRFFRSLELETPPAEEVLKLVENEQARSLNWLMLQGEAMIRSGRGEEGAAKVRDYLEARDGGWDSSDGAGEINKLFPEWVDRKTFAWARLEKLPLEDIDDIEVTTLYCESASSMEKAREAVDALKKYFKAHRDSAGRLSEWITADENVSGSAPGRELLTKLYLHLGDGESAAAAAGIAAEMDPSRIPNILEMIQTVLDAGFADSPPLLSIQAELYARGGNEQRASELIMEMESHDTLEKDELLRLSGEVLRHCGVTLEGVVSTVQLGIRNSRVADALPYCIEFYRNNPESHELFAERIEGIAAEDPDAWTSLSDFIELFAAEEDLGRSMRFLRAKAHLKCGRVERAVFGFDQLMMFDDSLRSRVTELYEEAAVDTPDNTTLQLALYQIGFEDERYVAASKHLGLAMESDPGQIRDIVPRFKKITERDPGNRAVWDMMLGSAMRIRHFDLARQLLKEAVASLPESESAALHIFGARISIVEGNFEEALRCMALTLTSTGADLGAVREILGEIVEKNAASAEARYLLGETMLRLGSEDEAVAELERCIDLSPAYMDKVGQRLGKLLPVSIKPWLISKVLGEIRWRGGDRTEAMRLLESSLKGPQESMPDLEKTFERLLTVSPGDAGLSLVYARTLARTGRRDESAALLERLVGDDNSLSTAAAGILDGIIEHEPGHLASNRLLASIASDAGERERALLALLRIASSGDAPPEKLVGTIEPFLDRFGDSSRLLVPLGALRCRSGDQKQGLVDLENALSAGGAMADEILSAMDGIEWQKKYSMRSRLLETDCLIETEDCEAAFKVLSDTGAGSKAARKNVIERALRLIEIHPEKRYYEFASQVLAGGGDTAGAESILREGIGALGGEDAVDLYITMGEILEASGMEEKAAQCFREVLGSTGDRQRILARIETAYLSWNEREIRSGLEKIEAGEADAPETERLVRIALDVGDLASAGAMIDAGSLGQAKRKVLLSRLHMAAGRVLSALAVAGSGAGGEDDEESTIELLYVVGTASELLGDFGKASAAYSRILGIRSDYGDTAERASEAYARFIMSQYEETAGMLVATGDLDREK